MPPTKNGLLVRPTPVQNITKVWLCMSLAALCWWAFNNFSVAEPVGFDPLRYEYYARYGLPNDLLDTTSYRIVDILRFIYRFLPEYIGFVFVISLMMIALRSVDSSIYISTAVFSPISLYYLVQTGKDGIAVLAMIGMLLIAFDFRRVWHWLVGGGLIVIALFIRPPIAMFLPLIALQARFGMRQALLATPLLVVVFNYSIDVYGISSSLDTVTNDEGAGAMALLLRRLTLGYEITPIAIKCGLFFISPIFQPFLAFFKFLTSGETFVLLEGTAYAAFVYDMFRRKIMVKFFVNSVPYCILIGCTSPFYHFRYLAVTYPIIYLFARYSVRYKPIAQRKREADYEPAPVTHSSPAKA